MGESAETNSDQRGVFSNLAAEMAERVLGLDLEADHAIGPAEPKQHLGPTCSAARGCMLERVPDLLQ